MEIFLPFVLFVFCYTTSAHTIRQFHCQNIKDTSGESTSINQV